MATIGYATLQIIPSLQGVTEAIEKQVDGKVVNVTIEPKVSKPAAEKAGKQAKETVEKHTTQVKVEPKVDQKAAEKAGKQAGKTVSDGMASSVKSSGKEAAKIIVDGIADGVKQELPRGGITDILVDGIADGVKQGIDGVGIGGDIVTTINTGIKSGDLGGAIKNAVVPAISNIGKEIRSGAAEWAGGIADALRSGDIQGATDDIGNTVRRTTDLIADIGTTFGLQIDGVREFGDSAATTLSQVSGDIQKVVDTANEFSDTLTTVGTVLETVLPGKTSKGVASMIAEFGKLAGPIAALNAGVDMLPKNLQVIAASAIPGVLPSFKDQGADKPWYQRDLTADIWRWLQNRGKSSGGYTGSMPSDKIAGVVHGGEYVIRASSTKSIEKAFPGLLNFLNTNGAGFDNGGTVPDGNFNPAMLIDTSRASVGQRGAVGRALERFSTNLSTNGRKLLEKLGIVDRPELLPMPSVGILPGQNMYAISGSFANGGKVRGYKDGGKVQLGNISGAGITTAEQQSMWDIVRGKFPNAVLSSATRQVMTEGHPDYHNAGRAIDISGPGMGAIASWIASTYPESLELIHSPFSHNIKNGKDVGDGIAFYGAGQMAKHSNHVHWALGKIAVSAPSSSEMMPALGFDLSSAASLSAPTATPESAASVQTKSFNLSAPSSLSGVGSWAGAFGGKQISDAVTESSGGALDPRLATAVGGIGDLGSAAGSLIDGQIGSAFGAFGVNGSPGWLKGLSTFIGGINVKGGDGPSATPLASTATPTPAVGDPAHGMAGGAQPGPQVNYNIRTATVEDAFLQSQRIEKERAAAKLARY